MKHIILVLLIIFSTNIGFAKKDFNNLARRSVNSSWENARAWAHYLVVQDVLKAMSKSLHTVSQSTISSYEGDNVRAIYVALAAEFDQLATRKDLPTADLKAAVFDALGKYRNLITQQFHLSWAPVTKQYERQFLLDTLNHGAQEFNTLCKAGRSAPFANTDVPAIKIPNVGTNITVSPSLDTGTSISISYSSGDRKSEWQNFKTPLKMYAHIVTAASVSNPAVGIAVEVVFGIVDNFISSHEVRSLQTKVANAYQHVHKNRARNKDIAVLYREYCSVVSKGLNSFVSIINLPKEKISLAIKYSQSQEFDERFRSWAETENIIRQASCRADLIKNYLDDDCPFINIKERQTKFVSEPSCFQAMRRNQKRAKEICPQIEVSQENYCRIETDQVTLRPLVNSDDSNCKVNSQTYECSPQHLEDLRLSGREQDVVECETREERRLAKIQREKDLEKLWQETFDDCTKNAQNKEENCKRQADGKKRQMSKKSAEQIEQEELKRFQESDLEREQQRKVFKKNVQEAGELLGYFTLKAIADHDSIYKAIMNSENLLEAKRKAARSRLLHLIIVVQNSFNSNILQEETKANQELLKIQSKFVRLGAKAISNIMLGKNNFTVTQDLHDLVFEFESLTDTYPSLQLLSLSDAIYGLIRELS